MSNHAEPADTRDRVLAAIRTAPAPPTVDELAASLGLHRNSVRLHAAALKDAGLVTQGSRPSHGRGRPQTTYRTSRRGAWTGRRDYRLLASLLLSELGGNDFQRSVAAERVGRSWGRGMAARGYDDDDNTTSDRVVGVLDELGFEPTTISSAGEFELRNCPFRELVDSHGGAVCALHAGMLDGLAGQDGHRSSVELLPFTSPHACTVRMSGR